MCVFVASNEPDFVVRNRVTLEVWMCLFNLQLIRIFLLRLSRFRGSQMAEKKQQRQTEIIHYFLWLSIGERWQTNIGILNPIRGRGVKEVSIVFEAFFNFLKWIRNQS